MPEPPLPRLPELLAPAGSIDALRAAVACGADAVYLGGKRFSARQYADNFDDRELAEAVGFAHGRGVRIYVAVNTLLHDREIPDAARYLIFLSGIGVDAVLVQDPGLAALAREVVPGLPLHASTQMTIHNTRRPRMGRPHGPLAGRPRTGDLPRGRPGDGREGRGARVSGSRSSSTGPSATPGRGSASSHRPSGDGAGTAAGVPSRAGSRTPWSGETPTNTAAPACRARPPRRSLPPLDKGPLPLPVPRPGRHVRPLPPSRSKGGCGRRSTWQR